ncbi:TPA: EthD domain-containing protein [Klebsiella variicola]
MHSIVFVFKRKPGISQEMFHYHYAVIHGAYGASLPGLIEYTHYPVRPVSDADVHIDEATSNGFDALSIYSFIDEKHAKMAWNSIENVKLQEDTLKFIDIETMITLPVVKRKVL